MSVAAAVVAADGGVWGLASADTMGVVGLVSTSASVSSWTSDAAVHSHYAWIAELAMAMATERARSRGSARSMEETGWLRTWLAPAGWLFNFSRQRKKAVCIIVCAGI